ncbi:MAG: response regulator [Magnetococcales bacterium]|nr:response regulator [Magnetococcales bacterium]
MSHLSSNLTDGFHALAFLRDGFFVEQMDYIYFIYGLSFLILGVVCLSMPREETSPLSWRLLGRFALVHGVVEWLELIGMAVGDFPGYRFGVTTLLTLSYLFLAEFTLRGGAHYLGRTYRPGISLVPLAAVGVFSWSQGVEVFPSMVRYGLAFPACVAGAWLLWREGARNSKQQRGWLRIGSLAMAGYGVVSGLVVPQTAIWTTVILNYETFLHGIGFPIQLARASMAGILTLAIWRMETGRSDDSPLFQKNRYYFIAFMLGFTLLIGGGWTLTELLGKLYQQERSGLLRVNLDSLVNRLNREIYAVDGGVVALAGITDDYFREGVLPPEMISTANHAVDQIASTVDNGIAYLMDSEGVTLASSNRNTPTSFIGQNFKFRPYFQQAMEGKKGSYFAYGVTSKEPGYFSGASIFSDDHKKVIGVAVVKKTLSPDELGFKQFGEVFLLNAEGVALLSSQKGIPPQPLWPLSRDTMQQLEKTKQFGSLADIPPLFKGELHNGDKLTLNHKQYLVGRLLINRDGWSMLMLQPEVATLVNRMLGIFITLLVSLLMLAYYLVLHRETSVLSAAKKLAEGASRTKSLFLANMSHEIRTPINAIMGMTHLIMQSPLASQQMHYLSRIDEASRSLLHIINDILDFSKIEAGKLTLETIPFSVDKVADQVTAMVAPKAQDKSLELIVAVDHRIPKLLMGDPLRLGQVLLNLVGNAIKFTEHGEVCFEIQLVDSNENDARVLFRVRDTGIGMTPEQMERLFSSFTQADASTTRKFGGTGLGLAISRHLVEQMGGQMHMTSEPSRGSVFSFQLALPLAREENLSAPLVSPSQLAGLHILVVDDHSMARRVCRDMLVPFQCLVEEAENGQQAVEMAVRAAQDGTPFDLVLMDWRMPGMDGLEAIHTIRVELGDCAPNMVLVTAYGREELMSTSVREGVSHFLMKPVTASTLVEMIAHALGGQAVPRIGEYHPRQMVGKKVLLVEDNEINQEVASGILSQVGLQVEIVTNGVEAVERVFERPFDAVLMDVQMPVMDGYEATRRIRQEKGFEKLPIIAMTANAMMGDREICLAAGMNDYVSKPIDPKLLYATLAKWITVVDEPLADAGIAVIADSQVPEGLPELPGLDTRSALSHMGNDVELYLNILSRFARLQADSCRTMANLLEARAWSDLERTAHTLKGVSATIGATTLSRAAQLIEDAARKKVGVEQIGFLLESASRELTAVLLTLESVLPKPVESRPPARDAPSNMVMLIPLFQQAATLLRNYNAEAEMVIEEMGKFAKRASDREQLNILRQQLGDYDYEGCLETLEKWALQVGVQLEGYHDQ